MRTRTLLAFLLPVLIGACQPQSTDSAKGPAAAPEPAFKLTASVQDIMQAMIDPSADAVWDSVGTLITSKGIEERRPHNEAEWQQVRRHAITLIEATNLLVMDGRRLVSPGGQVADQGVEGVLTAESGQQKLETQHAQFVQFAHGLHDVGEQMLKAIDARDPKAMVEAGSAMDEICEACHVVFWYPGQPSVK